MRFGTNHAVYLVVSGGNREKSAERSMTKRNKMISNLSEFYGKQENDNDFCWSARKTLGLGMPILLHLICSPIDARMEHVVFGLYVLYIHTRTYIHRKMLIVNL